MGVKHFYLWYRKNFDQCITKQSPTIDNFAIDLNGLFHLCAQKVYRYGNVNMPRLLNTNMKPSLNTLCREICNKIEISRHYIQPQKRLILCVDGIAGLGKMNQQRQRRFRSANSNLGTDFDPNSFTPGTEMMDYLTRYIDGYIKCMISTNPEWKNLEVLFSNEKVAGEGEHKIMQYIKQLDRPYESYCIYGLDADLIMLGMLLPVEKVCIFREMEYDVFHILQVDLFRTELLKLLKWDKDTKTFSKKRAVYDFVMLCFLVGNDFLPTIPSMAILDGTIDIIIDKYKLICSQHGHLTKQYDKKISFCMPALKAFLTELSQFEKPLLEKKYNDGQSFFPDPLVTKNLHPENDQLILNFEAYKQDYYHKKFGRDITDIKDIVHTYLDGCQWVLNYYVNGIPDWLWYFPHLYAPFLSDIVQHLDDYKPKTFPLTKPVDPFLQLLVVMPPKCKYLLPSVFHPIFTNLSQYFPTEFSIDVTGKRKEWEGIVQLPPISLTDFDRVYQELKPQLNERDRKRNIQGKTFLYKYDDVNPPTTLKTSYGYITECRVSTQIIRLNS